MSKTLGADGVSQWNCGGPFKYPPCSAIPENDIEQAPALSNAPIAKFDSRIFQMSISPHLTALCQSSTLKLPRLQDYCYQWRNKSQLQWLFVFWFYFLRNANFECKASLAIHITIQSVISMQYQRYAKLRVKNISQNNRSLSQITVNDRIAAQCLLTTPTRITAPGAK